MKTSDTSTPPCSGRHLEFRRCAMTVLASAALGFLGSAAWAQANLQVLKSFGDPSRSGSRPAGLLMGSDGVLYGTTAGGGICNSGTVFRVDLDGSHYAVLHAFGTRSADGTVPLARLAQGRDGLLYGATSLGGTNQCGVVFSLTTDGSAYTILHSCGDPNLAGDGKGPTDLIQGADGRLYGVMQQGGAHHGGVVFTLGTDGAGYRTLYNFGSKVAPDFSYEDGIAPTALAQGSDGVLYGVTQLGGTNGLAGGSGVVFRLTTDGTGYGVLHTFGSVVDDGAAPVGLARSRSGLLVGATRSGGSRDNGVLFTLNSDGSNYALAHHFTGEFGDGATPGPGLLEGADGVWYGTTLHGGANDGANGDGTVFRMNADASGYQVIRRFNFVNSIFYNTFSLDGQQPGVLVQATNGLLYGVTAYGGTTGKGLYQETGAGTLFTLATNASDYAVILNFSTTGAEGERPTAGLALGPDGTLYGTTSSGGPAGQGSVFRLQPDGAGFDVVFGFGLAPIDGLNPQGGLMQGADGMLYGTASQGGYSGGTGAGTVFKLSPAGLGYTAVLSFGFFDVAGVCPVSAPLQGRDGYLYGTTSSGGYQADGLPGLGLVYRVNTNGLDYSVLHEFNTNHLDGQCPYGGLVQADDGALCGTTFGSGLLATTNNGTVYRLLPDGSGFQVLHTFTNSPTDGQNPYATLLLGADGLLYGTTQRGGTNGDGTIFKLRPTGSDYQVIHHFGSVTNDGRLPLGPLIQGSDGLLYGTTSYGGAYGPRTGPTRGYGTAFRLSTSGSDYAVLCSFGGAASGGRIPCGGLVQAPDGAFYGTTSTGGDQDAGTVFRLGAAPLKFTSVTQLADRTMLLSLSGAANTTCHLEVSTNLVDWITVATLRNADGSVQFTDAAAVAFGRRFYRARQGPE